MPSSAPLGFYVAHLLLKILQPGIIAGKGIITKTNFIKGEEKHFMTRRLAEWMIRRRYLVLGILGFISIFFIWEIGKIKIESPIHRSTPKNHAPLSRSIINI